MPLPMLRQTTLILAASMVASTANADDPRTSSNSLLCLSSDNTLIACSNRDSRSVSVFTRDDLKRTFEVEVGLHPEGTTFIGDTHLVACCVYGDDRIVIIDADSGNVVQTIEVFDEPYGIVTSRDGRYLFATLEYPGQVVRIDTQTWKIDAEWQVGPMPRGIAVAADQNSLFVTEYLTANLLQISAADGRLLSRWDGSGTDNICRQVTVHPTLPKAYLPHIRSKVTAAHGNGSIFPYVTAVTVTQDESSRRLRIPMDSFRGARVVANPWEVELSPDGRRAYAVFGATNDMFVATVVGDDYTELQFEAAVPLGSNPRAVRASADGRSLYVYNALDFELVEFDTATLTAARTASVTDHPLPEPLRTGKALFYTALQPMSGRQWIACSSCHIDGDADGRTWQQPEGLRQTQPLKGLAWTHPLHWSADRDEVQDFEHTIQGDLMQGRGFVKDGLPDALGEPIAGRSELLDAIAVYSNSHKFTLSPHSKNGLSAAARRGRDVFFADSTGCATCHSGPMYTDSRGGSPDEFVLHDVGTGNDDPSELMGPKYETPTLLGIYRSAPYLHHGRAATLKEVLTSQNSEDRHGTTSHLSDQQIDDLVEFLKALPYEDPEPAAEAAGLRKVTGL